MTTDLTLLVSWLISHGYLVFLLVVILEGPFATIAGGVAAALGFFDIYLIILFAIAGDITGDIFYYLVGYYRSEKILNSKFFRYFGMTQLRADKMVRLIHKHLGKAVIIAKLSPMMGPVGHVLIGTSRASLKKFLLTTTLVTIVKSTFFAILGYFSVKAYLDINKILNRTEYAILGIAVLVFLIYFFYLKLTKRVTKKMEEGE